MDYFFIFVIINVMLAAIDAGLIKKNIKIKHGINGFIYLSLVIVVYLLNKDILTSIGLLIVRIPIFNISLNYFRKLPLNYLSDSTKSIVDRITNWIPKKIGFWKYHIFLLFLSIFLILN